MGDDDHGHARPAGGILQQLQDLFPGQVIQRAGGLVAKQQLRILRQRPGNGHALLLPAGELGGEIQRPIPKTHLFHHVHGVQGFPADLGRQFHVFDGGEVLDQIVKLENEAHVVTPVGGQLPLGEGGDIRSLQQHMSGGEPVHAAQDVEQGGLARAGGADDHADLPLFDGEVHVVQRFDADFAHLIDLPHVPEFHEAPGFLFVHGKPSFPLIKVF